MKRLRLPIAILLLGLSSPAVAAGMGTQDSTQAVKELVRQGTAEYTKQHWEAARAAFLKAWELKQHYAIAANLGDVELKLGRYREAAEHIKYALANLPPEHAERRSDAEASLKECRAHLSAVRVSVSVTGTTVRLDGQEVPQEVLADELLLDPGPHKLEGEKAGYLVSSRDFLAAAGESREVRLDLSPQPPPADVSELGVGTANKPAENMSEAHSSRPAWILISGGAATVVAAGLGTYFSLHASSLASDSKQISAQIDQESTATAIGTNSQCATNAAMRPEACDRLMQNNSQRTHTLNAATASWVASGVLGVATVVAYLVWPTRSGDTTPKSARVVIAPWLADARGGMMQLSF
jgi:tetratricopeptide (TPR) repeat protein